ncbi:hypothetical protein BKA67DRAFT_555928 [Truncatella angustata]|uniref:Uncharacterized protein n=1 Tax=Truncatella angustata TaxID=152316 RepID=A0A9P8UT15_9PEZI|nr:uncharacterized protein BKA67DRAFT_555928 [Truncatella angustata]KAH6657661.1 hypothetical protein BKA67DRAFT_555928 [Truncatella angustata]
MPGRMSTDTESLFGDEILANGLRPLCGVLILCTNCAHLTYGTYQFSFSFPALGTSGFSLAFLLWSRLLFAVAVTWAHMNQSYTL